MNPAANFQTYEVLLGAVSGGNPVATAFRAAYSGASRGFRPASVDDFTYSEPRDIGALPYGKVFPYAFDLSQRDLILTAHADPNAVLDEPFLHAAQRKYAHAAIRVPFGALDRLFGPPDKAARPILVFSMGRSGSTLFHALARTVTGRAFSEPDTLTQLAMSRAHLAGLDPAARHHLVWHAISALLTFPSEPPDERCVIKLRSQVNRGAKELVRAFPNATYVFLLRRIEDWAQSSHRSFRTTPELAVRVALDGLRAADLIARSGVAHRLLMYEDLVASPAAMLQAIFGEANVNTGAVDRVMQQHSQAGTRLARKGPFPGEDGWIEQFREEWRKHRPLQLMRKLGVRLEDA
jgi:hypothetical protein